ncbi:MAG: hypothetical protein JRF36_02825 [Deltaproteobacteria bacterium]|nr:hypothetical protein [Deltaproteobacteria bacterium]MBW2487762.1 hypothetical protein [Deltaproteobacteria bacterium]
MKILYGVQATGNGHISRSREVVHHLKDLGHEVRVILTGRDPSHLWDMETFEPYDTFRGLTFISRRGKVRIIGTALRLNLIQFYRDIFAYDASGFDLVVTDFEPVAARIARRNKLPSIGVGHQYAFLHAIPVKKADPFSMWVVRNFAPTDYAVGLHWHHFDQPILPPIIPAHLQNDSHIQPDKILVYLPFETIADIESLLKPIAANRFVIYCSVPAAKDDDNLHLRPFSRNGFLDDLRNCNGVISNAGFELLSEALYLGKKILIKPLGGQMEQASNAHVISELNLGMVMKKLDQNAVEQFLEKPSVPPVRYPDVARIVAEWIESGNWEDVEGLARSAWKDIKFS